MSNAPDSGNLPDYHEAPKGPNSGLKTAGKILGGLSILALAGGVALAVSECNKKKSDATTPAGAQTPDSSTIEVPATIPCPPEKVCATCKPVECGQGTVLNDAGTICYPAPVVDAGTDASSVDASVEAGIQDAGVDADAGCTCPPPPKKKITTTTTRKLTEKTPPPAPVDAGKIIHLDISDAINPIRSIE